jgi:polyisoprenyl-teichoic acid--peptidoglycan teichoic acid transferase
MKMPALPKGKFVIIGIISLLVFAASSLVSYLVLSNRHDENVVAPTPTPAEEEYDPIEIKDQYNILLLGYGGPGHDGPYLSDVVMLATIIPEEKRIALISIPRDLWIELPVRSDLRQKYKINFAFALGNDDRNYPLKESQYKGLHGGGEMAKYAAEQVVGMEIDHYLAVDFSGFENLIDELGGIEVDVPVAFNDYFYPVKGLENETCGKSSEEIAKLHQQYSDTSLHKQFTCRYEHLKFEKGPQKMDGKTALKFVRSRHSGEHGGDFARSQRQKALLAGVRKKIISMNALTKADQIFGQLKRLVRTDIEGGNVRDFVKKYPNLKDYEIKEIQLTTENVLQNSSGSGGQFILIPKAGVGNWSGVRNYINKELTSGSN